MQILEDDYEMISRLREPNDQQTPAEWLLSGKP